MPPPRRRRPVQPATRIRLPRTARPRGTSAAETTDIEAPGSQAPDAQAPVNGSAGAEAAESQAPDVQTADAQAAGAQAPVHGPAEADTPEVETPSAQAAGTETAANGRAAAEPPADDLAGDDLEADEPAGDDLEADEPAGDLEGGDEPPAEAAAGDELPGAAAGEPRTSPVLPAVLGVLAVVLGGLAVWFALEAGSVTSGVDTSNVALTNPEATSQVSQQITSAVNTIFSYNYADTARTSQAAATLLTGKAKGEYNTLFKLVRLDAPKEKLVLTTTVTNAGVEYLIGNQARVLIFANQRDTAGSARGTTEAGAMFAVNAVYQGGRWKIAHIDTFGAGG